MSQAYFEDQVFETIDFSPNGLVEKEYEGCTFVNCNFSNADLSNARFIECQFKGCNLSMAKMIKTVLNDVSFRDCKMLGLNFEHCSEFLLTVKMENCTLDLSSFFKRKLKNTHFKNCSLKEVDFIEADLTSSVFDSCDMSGAKFENTILEKADLATSYNYTIDPEMNRVKKAKFSLAGVAGLLAKYDIVIE